MDKLNLPSDLTVTVTTDSEEETTVDVSGWTSDPAYDGNMAEDYVFTPTLDLPEGLNVKHGVTAPQITVTVVALRNDITTDFTDANFLAEVRMALGKNENDPIYDTDDFASRNFLSIEDKGITSLAGIEYFTELTYLDCSGNQLTVLDVSKNTKLTYLNCFKNQLTELDVSENTKLTNLNCSENQLTELDVSKNTELTSLDCSRNQLTTLDVSKNTNLIQLICNVLKLTELDVSNNTKLTNLDCSAIKLTKLDVSKNTDLTRLWCSRDQLTELDVRNNTELTQLHCSYNQLKTLDVSKNMVLKYLFCDDNELKTLDVSNNTALAELGCYRNQLTVLDVSKNTKLTALICSENYMPNESAVTGLNTSLTKDFTFVPQNPGMPTGTDITANFTDAKFLAAVRTTIGKAEPTPIYENDVASIKSLSIENKGITSLAGIQYFTGLTELNCSVNELKTLDVSNNTELTILECAVNQLTELDVSNNTELTALVCISNELKTLDVSKNTKLTYLDCYENQLKTLDVSNNTMLTNLNCSKNYMPNESAVTGLNTSLTKDFNFAPQNYEVTVNGGTASQFKEEEVTIVTITASVPIGKQFKEWTVVSGEVTLANPKAATTTFTMPANAVEVTATYEDIPAGVSVSTAAELKTALEATTSQTINVTADITFTEQIKQGADHTLVIPSGKTVTASGTLGYIRIGSHTLIINGGGTFVCNRNGNALFSTNGTLNLKNIIVNITGGGGIWVKTTNIDSGATVNLNSTTGDNLIILDTGYTLNINTGGAILITNFRSIAIVVDGGTLHINGGSLAFGKVQDDNQTGIWIANDGLLKYSSDMLNATDGAVISLSNLTSVEGVSGKFIDGGYTLSSNGKITIGEEDAAPSADALTAGYYHWNSTKNAFEKQRITIEEQPQDVTVTEGSITGSLSVTASASSGKTISYQWVGGDESSISGAVDAAYTLPMDLTAGTYEYYCIVAAPDCMGVYTRTVTRTVTVTVKPAGGASTYAVTVNNGTASLSTAAAGANVTITAGTAPSSKRFKEWTVVSGGAALANKKASSTTFTMPANAVVVTATYEDIPGGVTSVTGITLNKTALSLYSNTSTKTANLTATITPADATDKSVTWQSSNTSVATVNESGLVTAVGNGTAKITVTTTDGGYTAGCTVTVSSYTSGGSSSGGSSPANTATIKDNQPNHPVTAVASVTATVGTNGIASAPISDKAVTDAISKAQNELKKQGKSANGISVGLDVTMPKGATALTATLTRSSLNGLVSSGVSNLEINGSPVAVSFDKKALTEIQKQANGNINITITPQSEISETARAIIGTRPVYNITVSYGNNSTVSSFGQGGATVAIPYTPANGEVINGLYAVYIDENGNATRVEGSTYDTNSGSILFTTPHFSMYGVGYTAPKEKLTDISNHWAKESIEYVVDKGIIDGATETTFAPDTFMTRETLVTALGRLTGEDVSSYTTSSFTDVKVGSASQPYIEWAYEKGIIHGIGENQFAPYRAITREEIAVIIANFTKATGYTLPAEGKATAYADASSIGNYYKTAVTAMQQAGIMTGGTNNKFNPKSNATRGEVSSMLHRYINLTITSDITAKA